MKKILLLLMVSFIASCGNSIPKKELEAKGIIYGDGNDANVIVYRVSSIFGVGEATRVNFNGKNIGYLYSGNRADLKLPIGKHTFVVDVPATLGKCDITFTIKEGQKIYFQVEPLGAITGLFVGGVIGKQIASAIESNRQECSGGYQINPISEANAREELSKTKLTGFSD